MILEIKVWGSREWYEEVFPAIENIGFVAKPDHGWADPETDGEFMGFYFDYEDKDPLSFFEVSELFTKLKKVIEDGEAPSIEFAFVGNKK